MGKTAFIFPGQGAQYNGMGKYLYENFTEAREIYNRASELSGVSLSMLGHDCADEETLSLTINSQPAAFVASIAAAAVLKSRGIIPDACAGFSLGECAALCTAGFFSFEDGMALIMKRAARMQHTADSGGGAMYAILGLSNETVEKICSGFPDTVFAVNYNCPGQLVIAGILPDISLAAQKCLDNKAQKAVKLSVRAAFHSPFMQSAADLFKTDISDMSFTSPDCEFYSNLTGEKLTDFSDMPLYMSRCMVSPVRWETQVRRMISDGIDTFIETGSNKILSGLVRKTDRSVKVYNTDAAKDLDAIFSALGG